VSAPTPAGPPPGTGQWVIVSRYQPERGYAVVNVYGPWGSKREAINARRRYEREALDDPRSAHVEYRVREVIRGDLPHY
jgi:hypothetical protein